MKAQILLSLILFFSLQLPIISQAQNRSKYSDSILNSRVATLNGLSGSKIVFKVDTKFKNNEQVGEIRRSIRRNTYSWIKPLLGFKTERFVLYNTFHNKGRPCGFTVELVSSYVDYDVLLEQEIKRLTTLTIVNSGHVSRGLLELMLRTGSGSPVFLTFADDYILFKDFLNALKCADLNFLPSENFSTSVQVVK